MVIVLILIGFAALAIGIADAAHVGATSMADLTWIGHVAVGVFILCFVCSIVVNLFGKR